MHLFSIEGNIGSGKSTFIANLKLKLKHIYGIPVIYVPEPVEEWESIQSTDGKNMIELFYSDPKQYAFAFQMMAYISRLVYLKNEMKKYPNCILISERSILADYYVFARMLFESDHISQEQFEIYNRWFDEFLDEVIMTGIIYLKTDPTVCFERCTTRARKGENVISLEYLTKCSNMHDKWLSDDCIPILELQNNTDEEIEEVEIFIKSEMSHYEPQPQDSFLFQMASLVCLAVIVCGYIVKVGYIVTRITS
jgi:deoxyadenosine/deoxycytidine kinase